MSDSEPINLDAIRERLQDGTIGINDSEALIEEVERLRTLLDRCWAAAGLLGSGTTGQPWQAWETYDLEHQIVELAERAGERGEREELERECDAARAEVTALIERWPTNNENDDAHGIVWYDGSEWWHEGMLNGMDAYRTRTAAVRAVAGLPPHEPEGEVNDGR